MLVKRGSESSVVRSIQEMLKELGFVARRVDKGVLSVHALEVDGVFGPNTEAVVLDFQGSHGLLRDGIVGPNTMKLLEDVYSSHILELNSPGLDATDGMPDRYVFERVKADKYGDGYDRLSLRNDVVVSYTEVLEEVHRRGGVLTSSGGIRSLRAHVNRSRSAISFHYLGRALDLYVYSGMVDPKSDPYVIKREEPRSYRVYCRCRNKSAELDHIDSAISYNDRIEGQGVDGSFFDLTALFADNINQRCAANRMARRCRIGSNTRTYLFRGRTPSSRFPQRR